MSSKENGTLDFDQFWEEWSPEEDPYLRKPIIIRGKEYHLTVDVEFNLLRRLAQADTSDIGVMKNLVDRLYGEGSFSQWIEDGLKLRQLPIILAWSMARIQGMDITFEEVATQLKEVFAGGKKLILSGDIGAQLRADSSPPTE